MSSDSDWGDELAGCLAAAIIGVIIGAVIAALRPKPKPFVWPDTLETPIEPEVPLLLLPPPKTRPPNLTEIGLLSGAAFSLLFLLTPIPVIVGLNFSLESLCGGSISFLFGAIFGYTTVYAARPYLRERREEARQKAAQLALIPPPPQPFVPPIDFIQAHVYTISLPADIQWQPKQAEHFIEHLLHKFGRLTFQIVAEDGKVMWRILDLRRGFEPNGVVQTIHAFYPDAEVQVSGIVAEPFTKPFYRYVMAFEQSMDFIGPIQYVEQLTKFDPLMSITQEMSGLYAGERVIYTLFVADPARFVYDQAQNLMSVPVQQNPLRFASPQGMVEAGYQMVAGKQEEQRVEKYETPDQKVYYEKLHSLLYLSLLLIQVESPSIERARELGRFDSHMLQFKNFPYNGLIWHEEPWPDSILYVDAPELAQATHTFTLLDDWLTNRSKKWQQFRLILNPKELASLWHLPHEGFTASRIVRVQRTISVPPALTSGQDGIWLGYNKRGGHTVPVYLPDEDRQTHINVIGQTGVGKSTFLHHLIDQDIRSGHGVAIIDPHGRLITDVLQTSIPPERENDVVILDLANSDYPPPLNPLLQYSQSRVAAGQVVTILNKLYGGFDNAPRMANALTSALMTLRFQPQATVRDVTRLLLDEAFRNELLAQVTDDVVLEFWEDEYENFSDAQQEQIRDPVIYRLRGFYGNEHLYPMLCHPNTLDFATLMREGKIILLSLGMDETKIPERERNLLGAMVVSQLQMAAMNGAAQAPFYLYIDEVQNFVTTSLDEMFSEARKFNLSLIVANQYLKQLAGKTLDALLGTVGAMVVFQCGVEDARDLAPHMRPSFDTDALVNLSKFQAAVKMRFHGATQPAFSLATREPLVKPSDALGRETYLRELSVKNYTPTSREDVLQWLAKRYARPTKKRGGKAKTGPTKDEFYES